MHMRCCGISLQTVIHCPEDIIQADVCFKNAHLQFFMVSCLEMDDIWLTWGPLLKNQTSQFNNKTGLYTINFRLPPSGYPAGCYLPRRCLVFIQFCQHKKLRLLKPFDVRSPDFSEPLCPNPELALTHGYQHLPQGQHPERRHEREGRELGTLDASASQNLPREGKVKTGSI